MTVAGNPNDYIIMFGGYGTEYLWNREGRMDANYINKIKTTFSNDFWVFNVRVGLW